jgi:hypothetical protein
MKKPSNSEDYLQILNVRVDSKELEELTKLGKLVGLSRADIVREALHEFVVASRENRELKVKQEIIETALLSDIKSIIDRLTKIIEEVPKLEKL